MCGLVGFVGPGDRDDLVAMAGALAHRGPDGAGYFVDAADEVHLGHLRLSIIDLIGGHQPMWNAERTIGVIYNGEIYNHVELRAELEARGHRFQTSHSDTEVLVHGYAEWGEALPMRLNGMFAFAVHDRRRRRLFLARDRFGEKPLYYATQGGLFIFASELKALAWHRQFRAELNPTSVQKLLGYGFLPAPHAIYRDAVKLPAGSQLVFDLVSRTTRVERYWRFRLEPDESLTERDDDRLAEELQSLLDQAVRRRLISDVPLGLFLSGGIDSSAVLASVAKHRPAEQIHSFSIGFDEPSFDESPYARTVARAFGVAHYLEKLNLSEASNLVPEVLSRLDEPQGDPSIVPTFLLSRFTRRKVTVALSGDGGDELFAGYDPFRALGPARIYQKLVPPGLHNVLRALADKLPVSRRNMSLDFRLRRTLMGVSFPPALWNPVWLAPLDPRDAADVLADPLPVEELYSEALELWQGSRGDQVDRTLEFYTNFYLQDGILAKVDRAAMMCSLESRAVFLDNDLVDFCRRLPNRFKFRDGTQKYLLKKALARRLPREILARKKKGFGIPLAEWLRSAPWEPPLQEIAGVKTTAIAQRWHAHRSGGADQRLLLWNWLSLQYFDRSAPMRPAGVAIANAAP